MNKFSKIGIIFGISMIIVISIFFISDTIMKPKVVEDKVVEDKVVEDKVVEPKVAMIYYASSLTVMKTNAWLDNASKFGIVIIAITSSASEDDKDAIFLGLKSRNPNIVIYNYSDMSESYSDTSKHDDNTVKLLPNTENLTKVEKLNKEKWWLYHNVSNYGTNAARATTSNPQIYLTNPTNLTASDANGKTFAKWWAAAMVPTKESANNHNHFLDIFKYSKYSGIWNTSRLPLQVDTWENHKQSIRQALRDEVDEIRKISPTALIIGNGEQSPKENVAFWNSAEINNILNGALIEGAIGASYSSPWTKMLAHYQILLDHTIFPKHVIVATRGNSTTDYATMRYGLSSTMLNDGWYAFQGEKGYVSQTWYDEFSAPIGIPSELPPTKAVSGNIWKRDYTNGIVIVNISPTLTESYTLTSDYKRILGTQDPITNNGMRVTGSILIPPHDGVILLKD